MLFGLLVCLVQASGTKVNLNQTQDVSVSSIFAKSTCIRQGTSTEPALTIRNRSNLVVDFSKATLESNAVPYTNEETHQGIGLLISHCKNVSIKNLNVYGYKVNILVDHCTNVSLDKCDASFSHGERIREDGKPIDTFLNLRSKKAWLGYGAGIEFRDCDHCIIENCRTCDSQNGYLAIDSKHSTFTNNNSSFNSGWGIGLWKSSYNTLAFDHSDYCNRPWGGDWGGDSAGVAIANSSHGNLFYEDSFTHGGDGFFLSDKVNGGYSNSDHKFHFQGGCNYNVVMNCDGSYSSHNAFESTFSKNNLYINDVADGSQYGFWIGFSDDSLISHCEIENNKIDGIAGGQGSYNRIELNSFGTNKGSDIHFWSDPGEVQIEKPSNDQEFFGNRFANGAKIIVSNGSAIRYDSSYNVKKIWGNPDRHVPHVIGLHLKKLDKPLQRLQKYRPSNWTAYSKKLGKINGYPMGVQWIRLGEYSPVDFTDHLVEVAYPSPEKVEFYTLEPGVLLSVPGTLKFSPTKDPHLAILKAYVPLSNIGGITQYTVTCSLKSGVHERYRGILKANRWFEHWYQWNTPTRLALDDQASWHKLWTSKPLAVTKSSELNADYTGRSPLPTRLPVDYFAVHAWTHIYLPQGNLSIDTVSDDGIKVYVDYQLVINDWNIHGARHDSSIIPIKAGVHDITVEYFQATGSARLDVEWNYKKVGPTHKRY